MSLRLRECELPDLCRALGVELRSKLAPDGQLYADAWLGPCLECGSEGEWAVNDGGHLNLTLLAPDIVEAIVTGQEPDGLSLEKLHRLPLEWEEQRRALG